jgi:hypothetical protein
MKVRVLEQQAFVYEAASLTSEVVAKLHAGDEIDVGKTVRDRGATWVEAALAGGLSGYVPGSIKILRIRRVSLAQARVGVRIAPANDANLVRILKRGDSFTLAGVVKQGSSQWIEIRAEAGWTGFIPGQTRIKESAVAEEPSGSGAGAPNPPESKPEPPAAPQPTENKASVAPGDSGEPDPVQTEVKVKEPLAPPPPVSIAGSDSAEIGHAPAEIKIQANPSIAALISKEGFGRIQTAVQNGAVQGAIISLAIWSAINIGGWALLGAESRQIIIQITANPTGGLFFLAYGSLIFGIVMLAFAALGILTRTYATLWLDGLSLIAIGIWNITSDIIAINALQPYGYSVTNPSSFWVILGAFQVIWGFRQFSSFRWIGIRPPEHISRTDLSDLRKRLRDFVKMPESIEEGIVKASITVNTIGLGIATHTINYTGVLLEDEAVMVANSLDDCFVIKRSTMREANFTAFGNAELKIEKKKKYLGVDAPSILACKLWCGRQINAMDMERLKKEKKASVPVLGPYLQAKDVQLRAAAVSALGGLNDPEAQRLAVSYLEDPAAAVKAGAVNACRGLKLTSVQDKVAAFLSNPEPALRIAAAKYLAAFPSENARAAVDQAAAAERAPRVKKEILKAQRALER